MQHVQQCQVDRSNGQRKPNGWDNLSLAGQLDLLFSAGVYHYHGLKDILV
jgi:hypothetical protein